MQTKTKVSKKLKRNLKQYAKNLMPTDKPSLEVLMDRAKVIAQVPIQETIAIDLVDYIQFRVGNNEFYGIPFTYIKEVLLNTAVTKIPRVPDFIAGIIHRRGILLTILDLKKFLQVTSDETVNNAAIIVVTVKEMMFGILVDNIEDNNAYAASGLDAPLTVKGVVKPEYIIGLHQGVIAILNIETIAADLKLQLKQT